MLSAKVFVVTILAMFAAAAPVVMQAAAAHSDDGGGDVLLVRTAPATSGENAEMLARDLAQIITPVGFMGWYCWYITSKTLPKKDAQVQAMQERFNEEVAKEREAHKSVVDTIMADQRAFVQRMTDTVMAIVERCPAHQNHQAHEAA